MLAVESLLQKEQGMTVFGCGMHAWSKYRSETSEVHISPLKVIYAHSLQRWMTHFLLEVWRRMETNTLQISCITGLWHYTLFKMEWEATSTCRTVQRWQICWFPLFPWWWNEESLVQRDWIYKQTCWATDSKWGRNTGRGGFLAITIPNCCFTLCSSW